MISCSQSAIQHNAHRRRKRQTQRAIEYSGNKDIFIGLPGRIPAGTHNGNQHSIMGQAAEGRRSDGSSPMKELWIHAHLQVLAGKKAHGHITAASAIAGEKARKG